MNKQVKLGKGLLNVHIRLPAISMAFCESHTVSYFVVSPYGTPFLCLENFMKSTYVALSPRLLYGEISFRRVVWSTHSLVSRSRPFQIVTVLRLRIWTRCGWPTACPVYCSVCWWVKCHDSYLISEPLFYERRQHLYFSTYRESALLPRLCPLDHKVLSRVALQS